MPRNVDISLTDMDHLLVLDSKDFVADYYTYAQGFVFKRGTPLGMITASGKLAPYSSTAADGTQNIYGICPKDLDTSATGFNADVTSTAYMEGSFNANAVLFSGTDTAATCKVAARKLGIYFEQVV